MGGHVEVAVKVDGEAIELPARSRHWAGPPSSLAEAQKWIGWALPARSRVQSLEFAGELVLARTDGVAALAEAARLLGRRQPVVVYNASPSPRVSMPFSCIPSFSGVAARFPRSVARRVVVSVTTPSADTTPDPPPSSDGAGDTAPARDTEGRVLVRLAAPATGDAVTLALPEQGTLRRLYRVGAAFAAAAGDRSEARPAEAAPVVSEERWRDALALERDLRLSEGVQQRMQAAEASVDSEWMDVAAAVQREVVSRPEYADVLAACGGSTARAVGALQAAARRHPDLAIQARWNRAQRSLGALSAFVADRGAVAVRAVDGAAVCAGTPPWLGERRWTVVVAGSLS